ncbi:MAG: iron export ABC transporter permease subunit FetB [Caldicoprobacterales bacterium]|jgi:putative ABC transport system permease protein|nr:iron export ABC transporter permease subunit FetB [Clostridia bacterium]
MNGAVNLNIWQLVAAYVFVIILILIVRMRGIAREKQILLSTVRMTVQLVLVGYLLVYLFDNINPFFTIGVVIIMEVFAVYNIFKRAKYRLSKRLKRAVAISMTIGTLSCLFYFLLVVLRVNPWYNPRYFIPIAGMIIGNSMTGVSVGVNQLVDGMQTKKHLVESALMLGASPKIAAKDIVNSAFDSAILPTINSMLGMGIVFLPGMMTGQILSGTSPLTAIEYQIAIMLSILGSVALTVVIFVQLGYKSFFNSEDQLVIEDN